MPQDTQSRYIHPVANATFPGNAPNNLSNIPPASLPNPAIPPSQNNFPNQNNFQNQNALPQNGFQNQNNFQQPNNFQNQGNFPNPNGFQGNFQGGYNNPQGNYPPNNAYQSYLSYGPQLGNHHIINNLQDPNARFNFEANNQVQFTQQAVAIAQQNAPAKEEPISLEEDANAISTSPTASLKEITDHRKALRNSYFKPLSLASLGGIYPSFIRINDNYKGRPSNNHLFINLHDSSPIQIAKLIISEKYKPNGETNNELYLKLVSRQKYALNNNDPYMRVKTALVITHLRNDKDGIVMRRNSSSSTRSDNLFGLGLDGLLISTATAKRIYREEIPYDTFGGFARVCSNSDAMSLLFSADDCDLLLDLVKVHPIGLSKIINQVVSSPENGNKAASIIEASLKKMRPMQQIEFFALLDIDVSEKILSFSSTSEHLISSLIGRAVRLEKEPHTLDNKEPKHIHLNQNDREKISHFARLQTAFLEHFKDSTPEAQLSNVVQLMITHLLATKRDTLTKQSKNKASDLISFILRDIKELINEDITDKIVAAIRNPETKKELTDLYTEVSSKLQPEDALYNDSYEQDYSDRRAYDREESRTPTFEREETTRRREPALKMQKKIAIKVKRLGSQTPRRIKRVKRDKGEFSKVIQRIKFPHHAASRASSDSSDSRSQTSYNTRASSLSSVSSDSRSRTSLDSQSSKSSRTSSRTPSRSSSKSTQSVSAPTQEYSRAVSNSSNSSKSSKSSSSSSSR